MHLRGKGDGDGSHPAERSDPGAEPRGGLQLHWHNTYVYQETSAPLLPKGTLIKVTAWHDNTTANKANPDPNVWVGYGDRTVDEMAHAWVNVTYMNDADYRTAIEERRKALPATTTTASQQQ